MRNQVDLILRAVAKSLQEDLLPALNGEAAVSAARLSLGLLNLLIAQETTLPAIYAKATAQIDALLARARPLLADNGLVVPDAGVSPTRHADAAGHRTAQSEFNQRQHELGATCEVLTTKSIDIADSAQGEIIERWLQDAAAAEFDLITRFRASLASTPAEVASGEAPATATLESIRAYLVERFKSETGFEVTGVRGAGFSMGKQIQFVSVRKSDGEAEEWVLRQEKPINILGGDCTVVAKEFPLMQCAHAMGLPTPEPLWLETRTVLGPPFMFMTKLPGRQMGEPFKAFAPIAEETIMQIGAMLARLHGAGLEPFEPFFRATDQLAVLDMDLRQATVHRIEQWERHFRSSNRFPIPSKEWLFSWLKRNVPATGDRPVLVHGDFNIHNMLEVDGTITALLDWEWGHSGNAAEDLMNIRPHVEKYSDWDRFMQHYRALGGPDVELSPSIEHYIRCLTNTILASAASRLSWYVSTGDLPDLASVFGSDIYGFEFHSVALDAGLQAVRPSGAVQ